MSLNEVKEKEKPVTVKLGGKDYVLKYSIASFAYLTEKYENIQVLFKLASAKKKNTSASMKAIVDILYAGLIVPDDEGNDTSGWSFGKVMYEVEMFRIKEISEAVTFALAKAFPEVSGNPTEGETK